MAGYSGTPLAAKLGVREGSTLVVLGGPAGLFADPAAEDGGQGALPPGVRLTRRAGGAADVVVAFFTDRNELERRVGTLGKMVYPAGGLWVAWPKKSSGMATTVNEDVVRELALPLGLVDNKVCAIDDTWSGLRVVWRRERRR